MARRQFIKPRYSGGGSTAFWKKVNALPEPERSAVYSLGVVLQNVELDILHHMGCIDEDAVRAMK